MKKMGEMHSRDAGDVLDASSVWDYCDEGLVALAAFETAPQNVELEKVLQRWEGAVYTTERDGDDSPESEKELADSRAALLVVLKQALKGCAS